MLPLTALLRLTKLFAISYKGNHSKVKDICYATQNS